MLRLADAEGASFFLGANRAGVAFLRRGRSIIFDVVTSATAAFAFFLKRSLRLRVGVVGGLTSRSSAGGFDSSTSGSAVAFASSKRVASSRVENS